MYNKNAEVVETSAFYVAERGGFEPPHGSYPPAGIRSQSLQPLGYLSTIIYAFNRFMREKYTNTSTISFQGFELMKTGILYGSAQIEKDTLLVIPSHFR